MYSIRMKPRMYNIIPLLVWVLLLVLPFISVPPNISSAEHHRFLVHVFIANLLLLIIFYVHSFLLYPLLKHKMLLYVLGLIALLAIDFCYEFFFRLPPPRIFGDKPMFLREGHRVFINVLSPLIAILCSFCYRIIIDNDAREQMLKDRETLHLRTELSFLRSQINPHFLFNTLNNLTSLARKKSALLEPAIVNLSQLMRYMLYESEDNKVPLKKEIEYLKSYIDLQLLRFGKEVTVKTQISGEDEGLEIDPMLLIPLVENAFKYGTEHNYDNLILISLKIGINKELYFKVVNHFLSDSRSTNESTGIGLKNMQRRLAILYPGKHKFNSSKIGDVYTSELTIDLS